MGPPVLIPIRRKVRCNHEKLIVSAAFVPASFGPSGKQANHYTTEVTTYKCNNM
jgi:hypothetical protein